MVAESSTKLNRSEVESLVREVLRQRLAGEIAPPPSRARGTSAPAKVGGPPNPLVVNVSVSTIV